MAKKKKDPVDAKKSDESASNDQINIDKDAASISSTDDANLTNTDIEQDDKASDDTAASNDGKADIDTNAPDTTTEDKLPGVTAGIVDTKVTQVKEPHHVSFFRQYVDQMKANNPKAAIKAANNAIKSMLATNDAAAFDDILSGFIESRMILTQKVRLQAASILPMNERAVLEIISTIYHALVSDPKMPLNLEYARSVIKNDAFITWVARKLAK